MPTSLIGKDGPAPLPEGKHKLFYFSAHWCPPCKRFTPKLIEWYNKRKAAGNDDVEVIFMTNDRDQASFEEYYGDMPWLAVPFEDRHTVVQKMSKALGVQGIPTLVLFDAENNLLNNDCVPAVTNDRPFPFVPPNVIDVADGISVLGADINTVPALIAYLQYADDDDQAAVVEKLEEMALAVKESMGEGEPSMIFLTAKDESRTSRKILELTGQEDKIEGNITYMILHLQDQGAYYLKILDESDDPVESLTAYVDTFRSNKSSLEKHQMK
uniref:Thioredoxin domain-containing protein n=2 Tax=Pinguiococcus pyrenoidosus TaxID=172671 RepID=A0A7R9Y9G1_9STRA|mmetsp:Transcript_1136/g.4806  ORF Transcript_1136/g.4806 Transcript_1136/m.4806 type:complete len:270 (+) Transcript_1136:521-1330(+)